MRVLRWHQALGILLVLLVGVLVVSCRNDRRDGVVQRIGAEVPVMDLSNEMHVHSKASLEQQIGITKTRRVAVLITEHIDSIFPHTRYRTYSDELAEEERRLGDLGGLSDEDLADARFDNEVRLALSWADNLRSGDIAQYSGRMHDAYSAAVAECARDYGITSFDDVMRPSVEDLPTQPGEDYGEEIHELAAEFRRSAEGFDQFAASLGFTRDELLDVRQSCSRYAAGLPLLNDDVREDLFRQLHEHYLSAVSARFAGVPEARLPLGFSRLRSEE